MKIKYYILCLLVLATAGCTEDVALNHDVKEEVMTRAGEMEGEVFYYYGYKNRKIFLDQVKDQVLVKFAPTATKEQFRSVVNGDASLKSKEPIQEEYFIEGYPSNTAILEGEEISSAVLNSLKAMEGVASATCLLEHRGSLSGITDELIVKLKAGTTLAQLQELAVKNNCRIGEMDGFVKDQYMLYVSKTSKLDVMQTANLFYETGLFEFAEPNLIDLDAGNSLDPFFPEQWGLKNTGQYGGTAGVDINIEQAWAITKGSPGIRIAVIDAGVDLTHPDLQGNLLAGYDATGYGTGGAPYSSGDNHGTPVAGIIGALQNNLVVSSYEGISGIAPNCKIVPIKASINGNVNRNHSSAAINWVANNDKAEIINCSFGGHNPPTTNLTSAVANAIAKGCIVVCSSGNNAPFAEVGYPANSHSDIIVVGAIDRMGARSIWNGSQQSNYGLELDVVAPGTDNYTTDRQGSAGYSSDGYYYFGGTSSAAPHVAGVAALMLSVNPNLTVKQVADIIESTAQKVGGYSYSVSNHNGTWNNQMGHGLVDASAAVLEADGYVPPTPTHTVTLTAYNQTTMPRAISLEVSGGGVTLREFVGVLYPGSSGSVSFSVPTGDYWLSAYSEMDSLICDYYCTVDGSTSASFTLVGGQIGDACWVGP